MPAESVGLLLYKQVEGILQVLLVHPGGPFWRNKDEGAWTIPKGERIEGEDPETTARREFAEEVGRVPDGPLTRLGRIRQRGGKYVEAYALAGDFDVDSLSSNTFEIEWPPRSGRRQSFPEVDRAAWFTLAAARQKINPAQQALLDKLETLCAAGSATRFPS
jgi:predicted NUDIX family NTP pyrophosphohydrolase